MSRLSPLQVALAVFGDHPAIGRLCGLDAKASYHWRPGSAHRDPGDIPSPRHIRTLLAAARAEGVMLEAEHLVFGMEAEALSALLAARDAGARAAA